MKKALIILLGTCLCYNTFSQEKPNIIYVICDDLGYGDIKVLAPKTCKITTPNADKLANEGMIFTDAHSGSSVCTPTRYGVITGRYSWRTKLQHGVVQGFKDDLVAADRPTVASFLKERGYHTAIIGKWHLNFNYLDPNTNEKLKKETNKRALGLPPIGAKIPDGPISRGFDYFHGFHHARDMKAVIEDDEVILHEDEVNMLPRLTRKSVEYIHERAKEKKKPFFLYLPLGSPHAPIVPAKEWKGKSGLGDYGDFVMQTDNVLGEINKALKEHGLIENTLIIFTSDNGCSKGANIKDLQSKGHYPSAHMRGSKADLWDGGHRIPFIVSWPKVVKKGSKSDQLICLTDLFATVAEINGAKLPNNGAEDSFSFLPALKNKPLASERIGVVHHSISGHFGYRQNNWKLLLAKGSGGWSSPNESQSKGKPEAQLYDLDKDPSETTNLYKEKPEIADMLLKNLTSDINNGHTRKEANTQNDYNKIILWKSDREKKKL